MVLSTPLALFLTFASATTCAGLLYAGKQLAWRYKKPVYDLLFSLIRFIIFITFCYLILQFTPSNSILFIIMFLLFYVGTVVTIVKKTN